MADPKPRTRTCDRCEREFPADQVRYVPEWGSPNCPVCHTCESIILRDLYADAYDRAYDRARARGWED